MPEDELDEDIDDEFDDDELSEEEEEYGRDGDDLF